MCGVDQLVSLVHSVRARLLVLDSIGEAMAVGGVDENADKEVGPWIRQTLRRIHDACPDLAIWPIDHSTKANDNPLFPSGSKRKRAAVTGRSFLLNVRQPFAVATVGYVQLVVAKDRGGTFRRGAIAAEIKLDATVEPYKFTIAAGRDGDSYTAKSRKRNAEERIREVLGESAVPMTAEQVCRIANGPDRLQPGEGALSIKTIKNTLGKLSEVVQTEAPTRGVGRQPPKLWQIIQSERPNRDEGAEL
jgi:hypothetical protein